MGDLSLSIYLVYYPILVLHPMEQIRSQTMPSDAASMCATTRPLRRNQKRFFFRPLECGAVWLCFAASASGAAPDPGAEAGWAAVKRCAQQQTEVEVHGCLTQVLRDAGLITPDIAARQQQRAFGLPQSAPRSPPPRVEAPASTVQPAPALETAPLQQVPSPDRVEVQIAAVSSTGDGRLIITASDGAVWRQAENLQNPQLPGIGERMTIRKGSLGSYLCTLPSKLSWRCTRSR
jgi:hypothetical protein